MDEELDEVARRLRTWRDEAGLTLQQLAERCHVATSTIQKIETRQMVPTIGVLLKIAGGLGRRASDFVKSEDGRFDVHHTTAEARRSFGDGEQVRVERLVGDLHGSSLEVWRVRHAPGAGLFRDGFHFHGEMLILCEAGELCVRVEGKEYVLAASDSLHFKADLPHGWENRGDAPVQFIVIGQLPPALRAALGGEAVESSAAPYGDAGKSSAATKADARDSRAAPNGERSAG